VSYALVEFDQADLLWRYTPARADSNDHLRPWLTLLVVEASEGSISPPSAHIHVARGSPRVATT